MKIQLMKPRDDGQLGPARVAGKAGLILATILCLGVPGLLQGWVGAGEPEPARLMEQGQERTIDREHLSRIYQALAAYRRDQGEWPNWLSELYPKYLADTNLLVSPVALRTGREALYGNDDPQLHTSYIYEFNPNRSADAVNEGRDSPLSNRELRTRQMETYGTAVPIVRCLLHSPALNLAVSGELYETGLFWESDPNTAALMKRLAPSAAGNLSAGKTIQLRVVDANAGGLPLGEARVTADLVNELGHAPPQSLLTDSNGVAEIRVYGERIRELLIRVSKEGYREFAQTSSGAEEIARIAAPIEIKMGSGGDIGGWVRDAQGRPVAKVRIRASRLIARASEAASTADGERNWRRSTTTDAEGRWRLAAAPLGAAGLRLTLEHPEFFPATAVLDEDDSPALSQFQTLVKAELLSSNAVIVLKRPMTVRGTVADAESRGPVANFRIIPGRWLRAGVVKWDYATRYQGRSGQFKFALDTATRGPIPMDYARVEADGYVPQALRMQPADAEPAGNLDVVLRKAARMTATVLMPGGEPAAGAQVAVAAETQTPLLVKNGFKSTPVSPVSLYSTKADGSFVVMETPEVRRILVAHEQGYGERSATEFKTTHRMTLSPWAQLSGVLRAPDGTPAPGLAVLLTYELSMPSLFAEGAFNGVLTLDPSGYMTETDGDGAFLFERVPPGTRYLWHSVPLEAGSSSDPASICLVGLPIVAGKGEMVKWAPDSVGGLLKGSLAGNPNDRDGGQTRLGRIVLKPLAGTVKMAVDRYLVFTREGRFALDGISAGDYESTLSVYQPPLLTGTYTGKVAVKDARENPEPVRFALAPVKVLQPGDSVPDVALVSLEGKPFKVSDYRGKSVVVSLLGSWANPGLQWVPALREVEQRQVGRAVVIHLLVEPDLEIARQEKARYGLNGPTAWLGSWPETPLPAELGVSAIPSVVVIDASGRLQARLESFENLAEGVEAAVK